MGIPRYFRYVKSAHPALLREVTVRTQAEWDALDTEPESSSLPPAPCDHLFLDFNCAIHRCARAVIERPDAPTTAEGVEAAVFVLICSFVDDIVCSVRPRKSVHVCIDGVPPCAKLVQQRQRRYLAYWTSTTNAVPSAAAAAARPAHSWDSTMVTPGTSFMTRLNAHIRAYYEEKNAARGGGDGEAAFSASVPVRVSDSTECGEGEQKIFRALRSPEHANDVCYVYGLDADLLVLSALSPCARLYVLRPADGVAPPGELDACYYALDVAGFRDVIHACMKCEDVATSVREYAVLCSLLGNDFVPGFACLPVSKATIDDLIRTYGESEGRLTRVSTAAATAPTADGGGHERIELNLAKLGALVEKIADGEDARMVAVNADYYAQCATYARRRLSPQDQAHAARDMYPLAHPFPDKIRPAEPGWRLRYYYHLFRMRHAPVIKDACANFLEALAWSINYHCQLPVDAEWRYRFPFPPTVLDVANYIAALCAVEADAWVFTHVSSPHDAAHPPNSPSSYEEAAAVQMMAVLPPPRVAPLFDGAGADVVYDPAHGCAHMFPHDFRVVTYLRRYLSECVPLLPDVDVARLRTAYNSRVANNNNRARRRR